MLRRTFVLVVLVLANCVHSAVGHAQDADGQQRPARIAAPGDVLKLGEMAQAAADLRAAGEAFERFGTSLENVLRDLAGAMVLSSKHAAEMSSGFDPFGFKAAFEIIDGQNRQIERLHQQQLRQLRKERKQLRKQK